MTHFIKFFVLIFLGLVGCSTPEQNLEARSIAQIPNARNYEAYFSSSADFKKLIQDRVVVNGEHVSHPETILMGQLIAVRFPNALFRGIELKNGISDLQNIFANGLQTHKTSFGRIYLAEHPSTAIDYLDNGGSSTLKAIFVVQVNKHKLVLEKDRGPGKSFYSSATDIPASAIKKIYIFDKNGKASFPFFEYDPQILKKILGNDR